MRPTLAFTPVTVSRPMFQNRLAGLLFAAVHLSAGWTMAQAAKAANPAAWSNRGEVSGLEPPSVAQTSRGSIEMKLRRLPDVVEVIIHGVGPAPQLLQSSSGSTWQGRLQTSQANRLRLGPQRIALPQAGLQSISLDGSGNTYELEVTFVPGSPLGRPLVSSDSQNLILSFTRPKQASPTAVRPDLSTPERVPQTSFTPPLQPKAVAPPLGDMAVGTMMLRNPSYMNVSGPPVTMTLRNAPAKDVLMALSELGGYGFVFVGDGEDNGGKNQDGPSAAMRPLSISFQGESYARAINSALLASGLQGKREGNLILAGPNVLAKSFGSQMSKVYRLNQASASSAADYLANLGATINKTYTTTSVSSEVQSQGTALNSQGSSQTDTATTTQIESYGAGQGPLRGLIGTTDARLAAITLVGDPQLVNIAENYLKQLDLRQRQVALSLKILDVDLTDQKTIDNSFAFRWGNSFIVNNQGELVANFGNLRPPSTVRGGLPGQFDPTTNASPVTGVGDFNVSPQSFFYPKNQFFDFVKAQIISRNTKLLASPTLILQENPSQLRGDDEEGSADTDPDGQGVSNIDINSPIGRRNANEGVVRVGANVVTGYRTETPASGGNVVCTPQLATSGLVLGARVEKIDDNGFVTFTLSPRISAITDKEDPPEGCGSPLNILSIRSLDTGAVRVRDGQTLILTGVISDLDQEEVSKWPILGDMPLIGQFFRASERERQKRELVILVTPRIIDDHDGGNFGYGYQPGTDASRELFRSNTNPFSIEP